MISVLSLSLVTDAVAIPPPPPAASSAVPPPPTLTNAMDQSQDKGIAGDNNPHTVLQHGSQYDARAYAQIENGSLLFQHSLVL